VNLFESRSNSRLKSLPRSISCGVDARPPSITAEYAERGAYLVGPRAGGVSGVRGGMVVFLRDSYLVVGGGSSLRRDVVS